MIRRRSAFVRVFLILVATVLVAGSAWADKPQDAQALKALTQAMDEDFLQTRFDDALLRLQGALDHCGNDCTPAVKARLYTAMGSVLAGGKKQIDDAKDAFVEALKIDPKAAPDASVSTGEVTFAYERARKELNLGSAAAELPTSVQHLPPAEQKKMTPVPLYLAMPAELRDKTKTITVSYLAPGATEWKNLVMRRVGEFGFGINVPCTDLGQEGTLKYHILVADEKGAVLAELGSRNEPLTVPIKAKIDLEPPHWPGFAPPETCVKVEHGTEECIDDRQCNSGLVCREGACKPTESVDATKPGDRKNWVSLSFVPDISIVSGVKDICTAGNQTSNHFVCYGADSARYTGTPTLGVGDGVGTTVALGTMRLVLAYDRLLLDNITAGLRLGFAFGGASSGGAKFLPLHVEVRGAYYLGKKPFEHMGVRPFGFVSGGVEQVDTKISTEVLEDCGAKNPTDKTSPCTRGTGANGTLLPRDQKIDAYKQAGEGFVGAGIGVQYVPAPMVALNIDVRGSVTLPVVTGVISPEVGVAFGF